MMTEILTKDTGLLYGFNVIRILYVLPGGVVGGITTGLLGLLRHLDKARFRAMVAPLTRGTAVALFLRQGLRCVTLPNRNRLEFLKQLIQKEQIQLVQSCDSAFDGARAAYRAGVPHVWLIGGTFEDTFRVPSRQTLGVLKGLIDRLSNAIVVPSQTLAREQFSNLPSSKLHVIPGGIEAHETPYRHRLGRLRRKLKIPSSHPLVAMVGNFHPAKRHLDFLWTARAIHREIPTARFLIAGHCVENPPWAHRWSLRYRARITKTIQDLGLRGIVTLTSFSASQRVEWYSELDLLIVPSREGMSIAMLEAMAYGVPVVATTAGGSPEVIEHRRSGLLVPYRSPQKIANAALQILPDARLARRLGQAARRRILTQFTAHRQARRFEHLYETLLTKKPSPRIASE